MCTEFLNLQIGESEGFCSFVLRHSTLSPDTGILSKADARAQRASSCAVGTEIHQTLWMLGAGCFPVGGQSEQPHSV